MSLLCPKGGFDEQSARRYAQVARTSLEPLFRRTVSELEAAAGREFSPKTILDLGSGPGVMAEKFARRFPGAAVTGVEPSKPMLSQAELLKAPGLRFLEGSAEKIPLPDASADLVVSHNSIKHWKDRAAGLGEIMRVLKPGGWLWLCEIDRNASWADTWRFCQPTGDPFMAFRVKLVVARASLTEKELAALVKDLPLTGMTVSHLDGLPMNRVLGRRA